MPRPIWAILVAFLCLPALAQTPVVERRVDQAGGALQIRGITVNIPPGAVSSPIRFRLEALPRPPQPIPRGAVFFIPNAPDHRVVGIYRLSSSASDFLRPLEIELTVNPPFRAGTPVMVSAVYVWDGLDYLSVQVPTIHETYVQARGNLGVGGGAGGYRSGLVWVVVRAPEASLARVCRQQRGRWTGSSCER